MMISSADAMGKPTEVTEPGDIRKTALRMYALNN